MGDIEVPSPVRLLKQLLGVQLSSLRVSMHGPPAPRNLRLSWTTSAAHAVHCWPPLKLRATQAMVKAASGRPLRRAHRAKTGRSVDTGRGHQQSKECLPTQDRGGGAEGNGLTELRAE